MSDADKIAAIVAAMALDQNNVVILMRQLITNNLPNVTTLQLNNIMTVLGLPIL